MANEIPRQWLDEMTLQVAAAGQNDIVGVNAGMLGRLLRQYDQAVEVGADLRRLVAQIEAVLAT